MTGNKITGKVSHIFINIKEENIARINHFLMVQIIKYRSECYACKLITFIADSLSFILLLITIFRIDLFPKLNETACILKFSSLCNTIHWGCVRAKCILQYASTYLLERRVRLLASQNHGVVVVYSTHILSTNNTNRSFVGLDQHTLANQDVVFDSLVERKNKYLNLFHFLRGVCV